MRMPITLSEREGAQHAIHESFAPSSRPRSVLPCEAENDSWMACWAPSLSERVIGIFIGFLLSSVIRHRAAMTSKERALLLHVIDEGYDHAAWHGPTLRGSIRGVSAAEAAKRPVPGRHSMLY